MLATPCFSRTLSTGITVLFRNPGNSLIEISKEFGKEL
jgi:hypothetical protein